jgi:hypothetical protein
MGDGMNFHAAKLESDVGAVAASPSNKMGDFNVFSIFYAAN